MKPTESCSSCEFVIYSKWCRMQVNIWKAMYLNCRESCEDMVHHCSYTQLKPLWNWNPEKKKDFSTQCLSCMWLQWSIVSSHLFPQFKYMVCHIHLLFAQYCIEFGMIYSTGNMKILIAAYIKGNPYKLLNSVDSEGKFLIFVNY